MGRKGKLSLALPARELVQDLPSERAVGGASRGVNPGDPRGDAQEVGLRVRVPG